MDIERLCLFLRAERNSGVMPRVQAVWDLLVERVAVRAAPR